MPAQILGGGIERQVRAKGKRFCHNTGGKGVVHKEQKVVPFCDDRDLFQIRHLQQRITDRFRAEQLCVGPDGLLYIAVEKVRKGNFYAEAIQFILQKIVDAAVEYRRGYDMISRGDYGQDTHNDG